MFFCISFTETFLAAYYIIIKKIIRDFVNNVNNVLIPILKILVLVDPHFNQTGKIDMLIGADLF